MTPSERRYSQQARRSLVRARLFAHQYAHPMVDTDHILIGIWGTEGSLGHRVLMGFGIERQYTEKIVRELHPQLETPLNPVPYSRALQAVLLYAQDESRWLGHHYIGTEHILLGLVRAGTGQLSSLMMQLQISSHQLRQKLRRLLNEGLYESNLDAVRRSARLSELSRRVLNAATQVASSHDHQAAGLEHLLLVLARERRSMAAPLLRETGINQDALEAVLAKLQPDPTLAATAMDEVIAVAVDQADHLGSHYLGTDHILLAMTLDDEAISVLRRYGVDVEALRHALQASFNR